MSRLCLKFLFTETLTLWICIFNVNIQVHSIKDTTCLLLTILLAEKLLRVSTFCLKRFIN